MKTEFTPIKCRICNTPISREKQGYKLRDGSTHKECRRMQNKGLLATGGVFKPIDSTGKNCHGCGGVIDSPHAHRSGNPYHRECLV